MATVGFGDLEAGLQGQGRQPHYPVELGADLPEAAWGELDNCSMMSSLVRSTDNPRTSATSSMGTWPVASWKWGGLDLSPHPEISTCSSVSCPPWSRYAAWPMMPRDTAK